MAIIFISAKEKQHTFLRRAVVFIILVATLSLLAFFISRLLAVDEYAKEPEGSSEFEIDLGVAGSSKFKRLELPESALPQGAFAGKKNPFVSN